MSKKREDRDFFGDIQEAAGMAALYTKGSRTMGEGGQLSRRVREMGTCGVSRSENRRQVAQRVLQALILWHKI